MNSIKKIMFYLMLSVILFSFMTSTSAYAKVISQSGNEKIPIIVTGGDVFVPCANGGAGEVLDLYGDLHYRWRTLYDSASGFHISFQFNPMGAIGVGRETGDIYRVTGITKWEQDNSRIDNVFPMESTFINNFRFIGPGPENNFLMHQTIHYTINANGELTADIDNTKIECR